MSRFEDLWNSLKPRERFRIAELLVKNVTIHNDEVAIDMRLDGFNTLILTILEVARSSDRPCGAKSIMRNMKKSQSNSCAGSGRMAVGSKGWCNGVKPKPLCIKRALSDG